MVHMSLQASLPPSYWRQIYSPFVSRWFRGFPKMVSSDIAVAGRCGAVAEGHGRAHLIRAPCGWWRFDGSCLQAQTNALGKTRNWGDKKNEGELLHAVAEDLRRRGLGAAGAVYRPADVI